MKGVTGTTRRPVLGLALGGGAFRGLAHIGVLQAFKEHDIPIDLIVGTSMGAVIGALYATGMDPHFMQRLCEQIKDRDLIDLRMPRQGLLRGQRIHAVIRTLTGGKAFSQAEVPFAAMACDIATGELITMREGPIHEAVRASISIPGVFTPHPWRGRILVDGGVSERISCSTARTLGADLIVAVDVGARGEVREVRPRMADLMIRSLEIMEWEVLKGRAQHADIWITPSLSHINPASIGPYEECIAIGRHAAEAAIPGIKQSLAAKDGASGSRALAKTRKEPAPS